MFSDINPTSNPRLNERNINKINNIPNATVELIFLKNDKKYGEKNSFCA